jgi:hypothetical protein
VEMAGVPKVDKVEFASTINMPIMKLTSAVLVSCKVSLMTPNADQIWRRL